MTFYISEIFQQINNAATRKDKIEVLVRNDTPILRAILEAYFTQDFLSVTRPKYTPDPAPIGLNPNSLFRAYKQLYLFYKDNAVDDKRRDRVLLQLLESMCEQEAEAFLGIIRHNLKIKGLTESLVLEAFPGLFAPRSPKPEQADKPKTTMPPIKVREKSKKKKKTTKSGSGTDRAAKAREALARKRELEKQEKAPEVVHADV